MIAAILVVVGMAAVFGLLLGYAAIRFKVEGNPLAQKIDAILPQTQCGQCGFVGCHPYAEAMAKGEADINRCPLVAKQSSKRWQNCWGWKPNPSMPTAANTPTCRWLPSSTKTPASAAHSAFKPALWMRLLALPNTCTPSLPANAPAANCAYRPAPWIASQWSRSKLNRRIGNGRTPCLT